MGKLLTFGLLNGKLKNILEVPNGDECGCICPKCKSPLIAKANKQGIPYQKKPHFAHANKIDCPNAFETALHLLAKEVLIESKTLQLPDFHYDYNPNNISSIFEKLELIEFDFLEDEVLIPTEKGNIVADIVAIENQKFFVIELAKSHFVGHVKKEKIKYQNIDTIEIDLKDQELDRDSLKSFFATKSPKIYWIHNEKLDNNYQLYLDKQIKLNLEFKQRETETLVNQKLYLEERVKQNKLIFDVTKEYIYHCPLTEEKKKEFKNSHYFQIPILREIFESTTWDKTIHGSIHSGFYIKAESGDTYLKKSESDEDHKEFTILYSGLKKIQEFEKISCYAHCRKCKYHDKEVKVGAKEYLICAHKAQE